MLDGDRAPGLGDGSAEPLLDVSALEGWYGESHVLHGMAFAAHAGEVVTLLGRNGAGKSTTLKAIMGMLGRRAGSVRFEGRETDPPPLKWSALKYGFWSLKEDGHGKTTQARRDRCEAAAG